MSDSFRYEKKPSMKRRLADADYTDRRVYMITVVTEGRLPLFGRVVGSPAPHIELSALGRFVRQEVENINRHYPQVRIMAQQVMPDHLHFILFVTERLPVHLGKVIAGFKAGCNRGYRALCEQQGRPLPYPSQQNCEAPNRAQPAGGSLPGSSGTGSAGGSSASGSVSGSCAAALPRSPKRGLLFEAGYHDRVLSGEGQLQHMIGYILDNPRSLWERRRHSDFFRQTDIQRVGHTLHAVGNLALLDCPHRLQVRLSRSLDEANATALCNSYLEQARRGAVLISPFISQGEKMVARAAFAEGLPLVVLRDNGFPPFYKPSGRAFDACLEGRLLLLTPYSYHTDRRTVTRAQCNELNGIAYLLAQ